MLVVGINGLVHDSSVALIKDGRLLGAMEHERVCRLKHGHLLFPFETIDALLKEHGLRPSDVDCAAWSFHYMKFHLSGAAQYATSVRELSDLYHVPKHFAVGFGYKIYQYFYAQAVLSFQFGGKPPKLVFSPHHLSHFLYSYYTSPFEDAAGLIVDAGGEYTSTTLLDCRRGKPKVLAAQGMPANSLGIVYSTLTQYLGFRPNIDEYKVMGLASFGGPNPTVQRFFESLIRLLPNGRYEVDKTLISFPKDMLFNVTPKGSAALGALPRDGYAGTELTAFHKDVAYGLQKRLEEAVLHVARHLAKLTGQKNLVLGGGVFLNAVLNGVLRRAGIFENVYAPPAPHDGGTCIGAAIYAAEQAGESISKDKLGLVDQVYLGSEFTNDDVLTTLVRAKLPHSRVDSHEELVNRAADALASGKIIGWFQGKMEFGPRALGNRSILADPRPPDMQARVNRAIKNRESFRPFAPSVLAEHMSEVFLHERVAPHMITIDEIRPELRARIPAVTHVDGTGRPQSVRRDDNPLYYDLIEAFRLRTGIPLVLNTSFNYRDEPIVRSPDDAVRCFHATGLDMLFIGDYVLEKALPLRDGFTNGPLSHHARAEYRSEL